MTHPHLEALQRLDDAFNSGDFEAVLGGFTDDAEVHVSGQSSLAGEYHGKEEFGAIMGRYMAALGEIRGMETHAILADDNHGVMLQKITAAKGDTTITIDTVNVFHFDGGKVCEMWTMDGDAHEVDAFYDM